MGEMNLTVENRCVGVLYLVEMKHVGMNQIHTGILCLSLSGRALLPLLLGKT